ncbi:MAG TPA: membrane protein insertase YidC [Candidatus Acidoferrales bacterium]|nr:membrane protein insertase YidC [Candidatus Acidoferrales bacterium]
MSDEQRMGLAIILMAAVLILWSRFFKPPVPQKPPETNPPTNVQQPAPGQPSRPVIASSSAPATQQTTIPVQQANGEETVAVESGLYRVELSNVGGVVRSWKLKKYRNNETPPKPLELVNSAAAKQLNAWPLSVWLDDPKLDAVANSGSYVVTQRVTAPVSGSSKAAVETPVPNGATLQAPVEIVFEWSNGHLHIVKALKFAANYEVELDVSASFDKQPIPFGISWRGGFGDQSVPNAAALTQVFYSENQKVVPLTYKKLGVKDHPEIPVQVSGYMDAAGIEDTFFTAAFLSPQPGIALWDWTQYQNLTEDGKTSQQPVVEMAAGPQAPGAWNTRLYVGPKEFSQLDHLNPPLTGLVQYGYMSFIAKPLLWTLNWIYKYVPNYGWAIVLLTIVINMALFPLKIKGWQSTKRMQKAMPRIKALQEKYKKYSLRDPRRREMQEEMSAIYKEEGANPISGCLPQLVQFPIWFALYRMLQYSIELRHAPWIGWIHDLSARDPYYILPILMTAAMYFMTKMTPTPTVDPAQQKMMALMPLAFGFLFFFYSSGLVLYIFTSSVVGILQQLYLNKSDPLPSRSPFKNKPLKA